MIHFDPVPEPAAFDRDCRQRGNAWLAKGRHSTRPLAYWRQFEPDLARGFGHLCGYTAMYVCPGTVDHYLSWSNHPDRTYEWSNYRYCAQWVNASKGDADDGVLDPFQVEDGWFELLLPSLQLVVSSRVPEEERTRAEFTLHRLNLRDDERVIRQRREWLELYEEGHLSLEGLRRRAPLLATAVEKSDPLD